MIIENIKLILQDHKDKEDVIKVWYIKEYLQTIILKEIYEIEDFKNLIFYGWTSLRFIFNLNRLSEDLDFLWNWFNDYELLWKNLQSFFKKNNLNIKYKIQKFRTTINFKDFLSNFDIKYWKSKDLYIKIEISDHFDFCKNYETKLYPIFRFNHSLVIKSLDKSTLFASKLNAVLYRQWKKQTWEWQITVKWRDIYDLFWYLQKWFTPNINCVAWVKNIDELKKKLSNIIQNINFKEVILDIENFMEDRHLFEFIETNGKAYILEKIEER
jgi:hypothetical protein